MNFVRSLLSIYEYFLELFLRYLFDMQVIRITQCLVLLMSEVYKASRLLEINLRLKAPSMGLSFH